jgi:homospermidine synthase
LAKLRGVKPLRTSAQTAASLGVKVIHVAERDTQQPADASLAPGEFVNTWSVPGFLAEAQQFAEAGWGTHERTLPRDALRHRDAAASAIYLRSASIDTRVRSWVPSMGEQNAYLITHHEAASLASYLTIPSDVEGRAHYRPTVYYAYGPSPATRRSLAQWNARGRQVPSRSRFLRDSLCDGFDELGVLFIGEWGAYWYGSTLSLAAARSIAPYNSATSLQVVAGILGALRWMQMHPDAGVVEAEDMDSSLVLDVALPYLGHVGGVLTDWQPRPDSTLQFEDFRIDNDLMETAESLEEFSL